MQIRNTARLLVRFAEENPVEGLILVGAYTSDLGDSNEAASGYFSGTTVPLHTFIAYSTKSSLKQINCPIYLGSVLRIHLIFIQIWIIFMWIRNLKVVVMRALFM